MESNRFEMKARDPGKKILTVFILTSIPGMFIYAVFLRMGIHPLIYLLFFIAIVLIIIADEIKWYSNGIRKLMINEAGITLYFSQELREQYIEYSKIESIDILDKHASRKVLLKLPEEEILIEEKFFFSSDFQHFLNMLDYYSK